MIKNNDIKFVYPSKEFTDYLNKHRCSSLKNEGKSCVPTHQSMCEPKGVFSIPQHEIETFNSLYEKELKRGSTLGIMEKPIPQLEVPLVVDLDFKYELKEKDEKKSLEELRKHNYSTIKEIVKSYNNV